MVLAKSYLLCSKTQLLHGSHFKQKRAKVLITVVRVVAKSSELAYLQFIQQLERCQSMRANRKYRHLHGTPHFMTYFSYLDLCLQVHTGNLKSLSSGKRCVKYKFLAHRIRISEILPWDGKSYLTHTILPRLSCEGFINCCIETHADCRQVTSLLCLSDVLF